MSDARTVSDAQTYVMRLRLRDQVRGDIADTVAKAKTRVVCGRLVYLFADGSTAPQDEDLALAMDFGTPKSAA